MNLDELAIKYGTDKSSKGHWYTRHYEHVFAHPRLVESVLEVGVGDGASLRMWRDYFSEALIYGIDISEKDDMGERIMIYQCDQTDCEKLLNNLQDKRLEIIIEDASHEPPQTMKTLKCLWPILEREGWYVIEDMEGGSFPSLIAQWYCEHPEQIKELRILSSGSNTEIITFIQKR